MRSTIAREERSYNQNSKIMPAWAVLSQPSVCKSLQIGAYQEFTILKHILDFPQGNRKNKDCQTQDVTTRM